MVEIDEWFVAFGDFHPGWSWWDVFTEPGWRHCFAFGTTRRTWVMVDPLIGHCGIVPCTGEEIDEMIVALRAANAPILRMRAMRVHSHRQIEPLYCVSVVKHLLGLRSWRAITPRQLHREMLKRGAVPAFV